jgi:hypothetical protein
VGARGKVAVARIAAEKASVLPPAALTCPKRMPGRLPGKSGKTVPDRMT